MLQSHFSCTFPFSTNLYRARESQTTDPSKEGIAVPETHYSTGLNEPEHSKGKKFDHNRSLITNRVLIKIDISSSKNFMIIKINQIGIPLMLDFYGNKNSSLEKLKHRLRLDPLNNIKHLKKVNKGKGFGLKTHRFSKSLGYQTLA